MIWGDASDISLGGCFVEMAIPLKIETPLTIAIWLGGAKLRLPAQVASTSPGFGIGIRFNAVSADASAFLEQHLLTMA